MGDPQRGLVSMGLIPGGDGAVNYIMEQPNRGKRSIGLNIGTDAGRELLYKLAETSDVFLTSFLPSVRQKLQIDVEHIRAVNPNIVYARGSGQGPLGDGPQQAGLRRVGLLGPGRRGPRPDARPTRSGRSAAGPPSATWPAAWPSPVGSPPGCSSGPPPGWRRSSTSRCWAWPCGCSRPTSWPRASTAAIPCRSSTAARRPIRWSATTGPATAGSSPS